MMNLNSSFNRKCLLQRMARTKQTARQGSNLRKKRATFHRKATKQANALGKSARGVAKAHCRASKYYTIPSLGLDEQGKPKRRCPGVASLLEIRYYQKHFELLIPLLAFSRLVREVATEVSSKNFRFQSADIKALQEGSEAYPIRLLEDSQLCTIHTKRETFMQRDMRLAWRLHQDVITDDAMESFAQFSAQRKLQAEREARARQRREEEEERVRKAAFKQEQQEKENWWKQKMEEEETRKFARATSDGEAQRISSDSEGGGRVTSASE